MAVELELPAGTVHQLLQPSTSPGIWEGSYDFAPTNIGSSFVYRLSRLRNATGQSIREAQPRQFTLVGGLQKLALAYFDGQTNLQPVAQMPVISDTWPQSHRSTAYDVDQRRWLVVWRESAGAGQKTAFTQEPPWLPEFRISVRDTFVSPITNLSITRGSPHVAANDETYEAPELFMLRHINHLPECMVVWTECHGYPGDIVGQRLRIVPEDSLFTLLDETAQPLVSPVVNTPIACTQADEGMRFYPAIAYGTQQNQFLLAYQYGAEAGQYDIFASLYNGTSTIPEAGSSVATAEGAGSFAVRQNYPNPFNPTTEILFSVREAAQVRVRVYNSLGELVGVLLRTLRGKGLLVGRVLPEPLMGPPSSEVQCAVVSGVGPR
ncbi:MAG: hypothetical protein H5U38_07935 [Calditrichaeota bacterium]|nr:hypothetical protein [Calditrichota bacterium]